LGVLKSDPRQTGLDRGEAHGRRDIVKNGSRAEQRPANYRTISSESEQEENKLFNREFRAKLMRESNRKIGSREEIMLRKRLIATMAPCNVGLRC